MFRPSFFVFSYVASSSGYLHRNLNRITECVKFSLFVTGKIYTPENRSVSYINLIT